MDALCRDYGAGELPPSKTAFEGQHCHSASYRDKVTSANFRAPYAMSLWQAGILTSANISAPSQNCFPEHVLIKKDPQHRTAGTVPFGCSLPEASTPTGGRWLRCLPGIPGGSSLTADGRFPS